MKQNRQIGIVLFVAAAMLVFVLPMVNIAAGCFGGCDPTPPPPIIIPATPDVVPVDMDKVVSFNDSDLGVVLYKVQDDASNLKMDVYGLKNHGTESSFLFSISQDDLAAYPKHPADNILLAEMDNVSVYLLTTGEIQVNAGPDSEGKMHVKILDGIPWTKVYGYTVDAQ